MYYLFVHDDATTDLVAIRETDKQTAASILIQLQELKSNQDLMDRLTQHNYGADETADFHVSRFVEQWNQGKNLWRLKYWNLGFETKHYRIVYAFIPSKHHYHVLGVLPRYFNYNANHELTKRIINAYEDLQ